jgi:hypothetical protein
VTAPHKITKCRTVQIGSEGIFLLRSSAPISKISSVSVLSLSSGIRVEECKLCKLTEFAFCCPCFAWCQVWDAEILFSKYVISRHHLRLPLSNAVKLRGEPSSNAPHLVLV